MPHPVTLTSSSYCTTSRHTSTLSEVRYGISSKMPAIITETCLATTSGRKPAPLPFINASKTQYKLNFRRLRAYNTTSRTQLVAKQTIKCSAVDPNSSSSEPLSDEERVQLSTAETAANQQEQDTLSMLDSITGGGESSPSSSSSYTRSRQTIAFNIYSTNNNDNNRKQVDYYKEAGTRLASLLNGVGDGEEELLNDLLMEEDPEKKLAIAILAGGGISVATCVACYVCGLDPLGGASLSLTSLKAGAIGGLACLPLVIAKAVLWSEQARTQLPFLEDVHKAQIESFEPLLYRLTPIQTLFVLGSEVVPGLLLLLPAATGGIAKTVEFYCRLAEVDPPAHLPQAVALTIAAFLAGLGRLSDTTMSSEEYAIVTDALENSDRYYKVMTSGIDKTAADAKEAANAFKAVAVTWLARNSVAARFAAGMAIAETLWLGILWQQTGDLTASLVAGLASAAVDFAYIQKGNKGQQQAS